MRRNGATARTLRLVYSRPPGACYAAHVLWLAQQPDRSLSRECVAHALLSGDALHPSSLANETFGALDLPRREGATRLGWTDCDPPPSLLDALPGAWFIAVASVFTPRVRAAIREKVVGGGGWSRSRAGLLG